MEAGRNVVKLNHEKMGLEREGIQRDVRTLERSEGGIPAKLTADIARPTRPTPLRGSVPLHGFLPIDFAGAAFPHRPFLTTAAKPFSATLTAARIDWFPRQVPGIPNAEGHEPHWTPIASGRLLDRLHCPCALVPVVDFIREEENRWAGRKARLHLRITCHARRHGGARLE